MAYKLQYFDVPKSHNLGRIYNMSKTILFTCFFSCFLVSCSSWEKKGSHNGGAIPPMASDLPPLYRMDGMMLSSCQKNIGGPGSFQEVHTATESGTQLSSRMWVTLNSDTCKGSKDIDIIYSSSIIDEGKSSSTPGAQNVTISPNHDYFISASTSQGRDELMKKYPDINVTSQAFRSKELKFGEVKSSLYTVAKGIGRKFCFGEPEEGKDGKTMESRLTKLSEQPTNCL